MDRPDIDAIRTMLQRMIDTRFSTLPPVIHRLCDYIEQLEADDGWHIRQAARIAGADGNTE